jgi:hypothetical protein
MKARPTRRILKYGSSGTKLARVKKFSLPIIGPLERSPRHKWSSQARQLLLVFYRWYDTSNRSALNVIFNDIMGWTMKDSTIVAQFYEMKCDGTKACWEWDLVIDSVPFDDPIGQFAGYRQTSQCSL